MYLRQRVEARAERPDPPRLIGPERRLRSGERRDGDEVLGARRRVRRQLRRQTEPVGRRVEDRTKGPAVRCRGEGPCRPPPDDLPPEPLRGRRLERRHGADPLRGRGLRLARSGHERRRRCSATEQRDVQNALPHLQPPLAARRYHGGAGVSPPRSRGPRVCHSWSSNQCVLRSASATCGSVWCA